MSARHRGARFEIDRAIDVGISEPSDVTTVPGDAFFVVSDVEPAGVLVTRVPDFSGLAVDPKSGHLFVCSDESATVAEIALTKGRAVRGDLVAVTQLVDPDGDSLERVEGIAFDARGNLHVLLENDCVLWRFTRG